MFFLDPSGNALEFKALVKPENLFAKYKVVEDAKGRDSEPPKNQAPT
jgi:hypothetical protein